MAGSSKHLLLHLQNSPNTTLEITVSLTHKWRGKIALGDEAQTFLVSTIPGVPGNHLDLVWYQEQEGLRPNPLLLIESAEELEREANIHFEGPANG